MHGVMAYVGLSLGLMAVPPQPLHWSSSYGKALRSARSTQRQLLVVLEDTSRTEGRWTHSGNVLASVRQTVLNEYELCCIDVTTTYGRRIADVFGATTFPYTIVTNRSATRIMHRKTGRLTPEDWKLVLLADPHSGELQQKARAIRQPVSVRAPSTSVSEFKFCPT